jgi:hypothetical protein
MRNDRQQTTTKTPVNIGKNSEDKDMKSKERELKKRELEVKHSERQMAAQTSTIIHLEGRLKDLEQSNRLMKLQLSTSCNNDGLKHPSAQNPQSSAKKCPDYLQQQISRAEMDNLKLRMDNININFVQQQQQQIQQNQLNQMMSQQHALQAQLYQNAMYTRTPSHLPFPPAPFLPQPYFSPTPFMPPSSTPHATYPQQPPTSFMPPSNTPHANYHQQPPQQFSVFPQCQPPNLQHHVPSQRHVIPQQCVIPPQPPLRRHTPPGGNGPPGPGCSKQNNMEMPPKDTDGDKINEGKEIHFENDVTINKPEDQDTVSDQHFLSQAKTVEDMEMHLNHSENTVTEDKAEGENKENDQHFLSQASLLQDYT